MWKNGTEPQARENEDCVCLMTSEIGLNQHSLSTPYIRNLSIYYLSCGSAWKTSQ